MAKNELCILCGKEVLDGNVAYEKPCHLNCAVKAGDDKTKAAARSSKTPKSGLEEKPKATPKAETVAEKKEVEKKKVTKKK